VRRETAAVVGFSIEKVFVHLLAKDMANFYRKKITSSSPPDGLFADSSMVEKMLAHAVCLLPIGT